MEIKPTTLRHLAGGPFSSKYFAVSGGLLQREVDRGGSAIRVRLLPLTI